ncbi:MAG: Adenylate cyclase, family 3 [Moraxellaceae bacterium]|nr:Adenylate cyclase, family 3 [Moraxellaceae bacterium]
MTEQQLEQRAQVSTQHTRMLAYIVAGCVFAAGIFSGFYDKTAIGIILFAVIIPVALRFLQEWLEYKFPTHVVTTLLLIDGFAAGFAIAAGSFSIVPTMTILGLLLTAAMAFGQLYVIALAAFTAMFGSLVGGFLFGFDPIPYNGTPASMVVVAIGGFTIYVGLCAYYIRQQAESLIVAKNQIKEQQEQAIQVSRQLAKYLAPQVWESIFSGKRAAKIQNNRKKLSVFFSDIKDFTVMTDEMSPDLVTEMLALYFDQMTKIALKYGGTIDKFIGDAILIFFGDPVTQGAKQDAIACVSMAIDMRKAMQVLRQKWVSMGVEKALHIRMGITTGYCHVGNFGCESRMDYTIIGRDANLASRLQNAAEVDEILISNDTYMLVRDKIMCREKGVVRLKGIGEPVQVWQVVDFRSDVGEHQTWIEHELDGFAMLMDINKVKNYDKERIVKALEAAAQRLRNKRIV